MQHTYAPGDEGYDDKLALGRLPVEDVIVIFDPSLMAATHNYSCPVCRENHAVMSSGLMTPCWGCRKEGWKLHKPDTRPWWKKLFT